MVLDFVLFKTIVIISKIYIQQNRINEENYLNPAMSYIEAKENKIKFNYR